jgi:hypothetical protein
MRNSFAFRRRIRRKASNDLSPVGENKSLFTPARDRNEALALFGRELNLKLTLDDSDTVIAQYLLDEWDFPGPHRVNHTIPVFEMPADAN